MSVALYDSITRIARHEAKVRAHAGVGRVVDVFPANGGQQDHAVSVEMRDSKLVLPRVPIAVDAMGFAAIPAMDDLVVILFLEGDYNAPIVMGRLYHPDKNPPKHAEGEIVLRLPAGEAEPKLSMEILSAEPTYRLILPGEVKLQLMKDEIQMEVGAMHVHLTAAGGGRAEIAAGGSKITLKKDGDITISAQGKLNLEATEIKIAGQAKVAISGAQVEIN